MGWIFGVEVEVEEKKKKRREKGPVAKFNIDKQIAAWGRLGEAGR